MRAYFYVDTNHNWLDEDYFDSIAKEYRGEPSGAGTDFNTRDQSFIFKTEKKAREFCRRIKRWKGVSRITLSKVVDCQDDNVWDEVIK